MSDLPWSESVPVHEVESGDEWAAWVLFHEHYEPEAGVVLLARPPWSDGHQLLLTYAEAEQVAATLLEQVRIGREGAAMVREAESKRT